MTILLNALCAELHVLCAKLNALCAELHVLCAAYRLVSMNARRAFSGHWAFTCAAVTAYFVR